MRKACFKFGLLALLLLSAKQSFSQEDNYWVMGGNRSMDFSTRNPTPDFSYSYSGYATTICDSVGRLLFYSSDYLDTVFTIGSNQFQAIYGDIRDRRNDLMPSLKDHPMVILNGYRIIIPKNTHEYYIFYQAGDDRTNVAPGIFYTLVDMRLNHGYGDLEPGQSNIRISTGHIFAVAAAHKTGGGYWLLARSRDSFLSFPVSGAIGAPIKTYMHEGLIDTSYGVYSLRLSNDNRFAVGAAYFNDSMLGTSGCVYTYDFDITTGQFSNQRLIAQNTYPHHIFDNDNEEYFGTAFSPDDSLFYIVHNNFSGSYPTYHVVMQFQRYSPDISASAYSLLVDDFIYDIKTGPDGNIYFIYDLFSNFGMITKPDRIGNACGIIKKGTYCKCDKQGYETCSGIFANTIPGFKILKFTWQAHCSVITFAPKADSIFKYFTWYLQDTDGVQFDSLTGSKVSYDFKSRRKYVVTLQGMSSAGYKKWWTDTIIVNDENVPMANVGHISFSICKGSHIKIGADAITGHSYIWTSIPSGFTSTLADPVINPSIKTKYVLKETDSEGCSNTDSAIVMVSILKAPVAEAGVDRGICPADSAQIGSAFTPGLSYSWASNPAGFQSSEPEDFVKPQTTTSYTLTVTDTSGCTDMDSLTIMVNPNPKAITGLNHAVCSGTVVSLGTVPVPGHTYSWTSKPAGFNSFLANPLDTAQESRVYYLTEIITSTGCRNNDSVAITVMPAPYVKIKKDSISPWYWTFNAVNPNYPSDRYLWNADGNSSVGDSLARTFRGNGNYKIKLTAEVPGLCTVSDSLIISVNEKFFINIYPNPFGMQTGIYYLLTDPSHIKISVFDMLGRDITTLTDKKLDAGIYQTDFNGQLLRTAPGIYLIVFERNNQVITRRIIQLESENY